MRISAYVLAADPAWLRQSVSSYYGLVDRIVVSFDRSSRSWTGTPLDVTACLDTLKELDVGGKLVYSPGDYARPHHRPLDNETFQRERALDEASDGADWVVQLDTDEVVGDVEVFRTCLTDADRRGFAALDYPARVLHKQIGPGRFLEQSSRFWRLAAGYPGPVVVRAGTRLRLCRQNDAHRFRVDFRAANTDPWQGRHSPVHRVIAPNEGIFHFSWVRSEEHMLRKARWSGHAEDADFDLLGEVRHWQRRGRHPVATLARTPFAARRSRGRLRVVDLQHLPGIYDSPGYDPAKDSPF